jgi:KDO2-lipid IV(A) lauroyltransferase
VKSERTIRLEFALYRVVRAVSGIMPLPLLQALGRVVGVFFFLVTGRRRVVLRNLAYVFPHLSRSARLAIALRCAAHFGRIAFDALKWVHAPADLILRKVSGSGLEHLEAAASRGKGTFVLTAHFGHWEVAGLWMSLHGFRQAMVHRPLDNDRLEAELAAMRTRFGNTLIPRAGAAKSIIRTLRANGIVDILIDQKAPATSCVTVDFLGVPTRVIRSLAAFTLATGAAVVPLFTYPRGSGYTVHLHEPLVPEPGEDEIRLTARYADVLSRAILADPHLWLWFHDRWGVGQWRVRQP